MRRKGPAEPPVPREASDTVRHAMAALLAGDPLSAAEISVALSVTEKSVPGHLEHLRRSVRAAGGRLDIVPAECLSCGFVFASRERPATPSRCPVCREESVSPPRFSVRFPPGRGHREERSKPNRRAEAGAGSDPLGEG